MPDRPAWATGEAVVGRCVFCDSPNVWEVGNAGWKCEDCARGGPGVRGGLPDRPVVSAPTDETAREARCATCGDDLTAQANRKARDWIGGEPREPYDVAVIVRCRQGHHSEVGVHVARREARDDG